MSDTPKSNAHAADRIELHLGTRTPDLLAELDGRGLLHQCTDDAGLRAHLNAPAAHSRRGYAGFDPTADSLTIGNLVPIMMLAHFKRAGHTPVVLMGGGTGLIGDPSGKSAERQLMTEETVASNINKQRPIFNAVLGHIPGPTHEIVNNADWLGTLGFIEVLRDTGKHFSVNAMIQKDSVRDRLNTRDQGISYTEFSYMILQSYDFLHLYRETANGPGVTIQLGGSDQWGNITAGTDLIRKTFAAEEDDRASDPDNSPAFGLTAPLVTKADGGKFGKTEAGAIWLTKERTSVYAYYQFWLNAADADVEGFLKTFTFIPVDNIAELMARHSAAPHAREAQRTLARHATAILHGTDAMTAAEQAGQALFSGDLSGLDSATLDEVLAGAPSSTIDHARLAGDGVAVSDLLIETGVAKSKREAREFLTNGSVSINGVKLTGEGVTEARLVAADLLHGSVAAIRRGKKTWHVVRVG